MSAGLRKKDPLRLDSWWNQHGCLFLAEWLWSNGSGRRQMVDSQQDGTKNNHCQPSGCFQNVKPLLNHRDKALVLCSVQWMHSYSECTLTGNALEQWMHSYSECTRSVYALVQRMHLYSVCTRTVYALVSEGTRTVNTLLQWRHS